MPDPAAGGINSRGDVMLQGGAVSKSVVMRDGQKRRRRWEAGQHVGQLALRFTAFETHLSIPFRMHHCQPMLCL